MGNLLLMVSTVNDTLWEIIIIKTNNHIDVWTYPFILFLKNYSYQHVESYLYPLLFYLL